MARIPEVDLPQWRLAVRPRRVVAVVSDEEVVGVEPQVGDLDPPFFLEQGRGVLDTQTGCREARGLSALARGGPRDGDEREPDQ